MCCGNQSLIVSACLFVWIATLTGIAALFSPYWFSSNPEYVENTLHQGLFYRCTEVDGNNICQVNYENIVLDWLRASHGLWAAGSTIITIFALASFCLCCEKNQKPIFGAVLFFGTFIAVAAYITAVILFGVQYFLVSQASVSFHRGGTYFFDWSYYLAIIAAFTGLVGTVLLSNVICCLRMKK